MNYKNINKTGFTLIELLVVVLIIGILAAIALPKYEYAVLKSRYAALLPEMKAITLAVQRHKLITGQNPKSVNDLDITPSGNISSDLDSYNTINIGGLIGDYWGRTSVWLTLRERNNFKLNCESYAQQTKGVKLCEEMGGKKHTCIDGIWQGNGTIYCYDIPYPGA